MLTYFNEGGALFMGMLSIVFLIVLILAIKNALAIFSNGDVEKLGSRIRLLKSLGLFAFVLGFLGQFIGLFSAFDFIAKKGSISPSILAGGLKVSSITSIYGMMIFLVAYLLWFLLQVVLKNR